MGKSVVKSSEGKKSTSTSIKVEKSENDEETCAVPETQETVPQASFMNDLEGMKLHSRSATDQKTVQLSLEPGEASPLPHCDGEKVISERILRLANEIVNLTIFEVADLNSTLKKKLNLPDAPVFTQSLAAPGATSATGESFYHEILNFWCIKHRCLLKKEIFAASLLAFCTFFSTH